MCLLLMLTVATEIEAESARIRLPAIIPTSRAYYGRAPLLWGIRGGANDTQDENDVIETDATDSNQEEPIVVLTTTEEISSPEEVFSAQDTAKDMEAPIDQVPGLIEEETSDSDSIEEEVSAAIEEVAAAIDEQSLVSAREEAQQLRQDGKELHDQGDWQEAADKFYQASLLLQDYTVTDEEVLQEYATCRLHEALCRLKIQDYDKSVEACTAVLEREPPAAIRARALHRRSRAKLGLDMEEEALLDARQAAFLGDRKAVALYGKLMRQDSSASSGDASLQDFLGGGSNPFLSSGEAPSSSSSSALLESLLNKSSDTGSPSSVAGNPLGMLMNTVGGNNKGGLAKSVLSSLSKTVENESTQENICRYLQNASVGQVQQMAAMAGVPLSESHASRLVNFCHGVTPKGISRSVKTTKRLWYVVSLLRKVAQIISKYRIVLILWALSIWIKSAVRRPIPINKRAAKIALKQAMNQGAV